MKSNPYTSGRAADQTIFRSGFVTSFNPDKRVYTVDVVLKGETTCKQITGGVFRPYARGTKVAVAYFPGSEWVIVGELPQSAIPPTKTADSEEETLAVGRGRAQTASEVSSTFVPSYRTIDSVGESESPIFEGDAIVENRSDRVVTRSFLQIFKFGDILLKSSYFCYIHLHKLRSTIIIKARNFIERFAGYTRDISTPAKGALANRTTVTEEYRADPLSETADLTYRFADLTQTTSNLLLGTEMLFSGGYEHTDLTTDTKRIKQNSNYLLVGSLSDSAPSGTFNLPKSYEGRGVGLQTSKNNLTLLEDQETIVLELHDSDTKINIDPNAVSISRQGQSFVLSDTGLEIDVDNLSINVSGNTDISTAGAMRLTGTTIDLN